MNFLDLLKEPLNQRLFFVVAGYYFQPVGGIHKIFFTMFPQ